MARKKEDQNEIKKGKSLEEGFITGTGRRKTAVASVFLWDKKGDMKINDKPIEAYFPSELEKILLFKPFHLIGVSHPSSRFSLSIKISGSGKSAQLGAVVHGISRALAKMDEEYARILRKQGLLTRDSRMVERKKYWLRKARKAPQYSKR